LPIFFGGLLLRENRGGEKEDRERERKSKSERKRDRRKEEKGR